MIDLKFRLYQPDDKDVCMAIFMSNTPRYFGTAEAPDFQKFLETLPCPYYVVTQKEKVIACGGYGHNPSKEAIVLAWGMGHGACRFPQTERGQISAG